MLVFGTLRRILKFVIINGNHIFSFLEFYRLHVEFDEADFSMTRCLRVHELVVHRCKYIHTPKKTAKFNTIKRMNEWIYEWICKNALNSFANGNSFIRVLPSKFFGKDSLILLNSYACWLNEKKRHSLCIAYCAMNKKCSSHFVTIRVNSFYLFVFSRSRSLSRCRWCVCVPFAIFYLAWWRRNPMKWFYSSAQILWRCAFQYTSFISFALFIIITCRQQQLVSPYQLENLFLFNEYSVFISSWLSISFCTIQMCHAVCVSWEKETAHHPTLRPPDRTACAQPFIQCIPLV